MNLVLIGPPGAGKGTVASELKVQYGLPHISSGDIVRGEIARKTPFGEKVAKLTASGQLLPDTPEFMGELMGLVKTRMSQPDCKNGFVLDGIPRTLAQAVELDKVFEELGIPMSAVILLDVQKDVLRERLAGRLTCSSCGRTYHKVARPPKKGGVCDDCCHELMTRPDDSDESVQTRLETYDREFSPIIKYYQKRPSLLRLDGNSGTSGLVEKIAKFVEAPLPRTYLQQRIAKYPPAEEGGVAMYNLIEMYKDREFIDFVVSAFQHNIAELNPDYLAAPEARALPIFGALIHTSFKPGIFIRKSGRLPAAVPKLREVYSTAYSSDAIEIYDDPQLRGKTVVVIDDGISSGGTTLATVRLLEQAGMKVLRVLAVVQYHYRELDPAYLGRGLDRITTTLQDLQ
jgi:adenylate kinase